MGTLTKDPRFIGTTWHKVAKRWQAHASIAGRFTYLGLFVTREEAAAAAQTARKVHPPVNLKAARQDHMAQPLR